MTSSKIEINSGKYFAYCGIGGILACGTTHFSMTPIDMVKCRMQIDNTVYRNLTDGLHRIWKHNGIQGVYRGGLPTLLGYSMQGMGKYGFYEFFKYEYSQAMPTANKTALFLAASATAEFFADIMLCPMEAFKVRLQTSGTPFCSGFVDGLSRIYRSEGLHGFYKGIVPLWMRQIPYTMVKFASFENIVAGIYHSVLRRPKSEFTKGQQLGVTCTAGYLAGILCAIVSHPADTIVSKLNSSAQGTSAGQIVRELGMRGLWAGLLPRIFMIGTLTCTQWTIYDSFKVKIGLPTTGGN
ncbi:Cu/Pi carrier [Coemansia sp. RSA 520]|nr:Cu/Pi carrier [Coemansia sp. RSA 530]KAJ2217454.1 Cu/Pi carrier [Coemansia sp. RSA 520]KAJ2258315.1 Cu/Pi carrier [Coemansia sp. RSA 454]KAJ2427938.1 Cu/Pi carrier [Coemansia sp. RSA 2522]KAJ2728354.1 Cu/Pi carrier [Coemansia sp. D1744]